jgi:hypothetical protein
MTEPNEETTVIETVETKREAVTTPASVEPVGMDLGKVRELVLRAHPDVVPDLVWGSSVDELIASVEPARSAYQRIAEQVRGSGAETTVTTETKVVEQPPVVPAGGGSTVVDPGALAPTSKIARALAERGTRSS